MQFDLQDAIALFNTRIATQGAFWSYFSAISLGVLGFLGAQARPVAVKRILVSGFIFFCVCNGGMIFVTQIDLVTVSNSVQAFLSAHPDAVANEFDPIMNRIAVLPVIPVIGFYCAVSSVLIFAMVRMKSESRTRTTSKKVSSNAAMLRRHKNRHLLRGRVSAAEPQPRRGQVQSLPRR
jgi:hypothetical protein